MAQNPGIRSGRSTVHAKGAGLSNHKLSITSNNTLMFGESIGSPVRGGEGFLQKLALYLLVMRVSAAVSFLTKQKVDISVDVFGTAGRGDSVNF